MLQNPDIQPSASMNHWIMAILMFQFELVHVKGTFHGPDGLYQCPPQPSDPSPDTSDNNIFEDWIDRMNGLMHQIQLPLPLARRAATTHLLPTHALYPLCSLATFVTAPATTTDDPAFLRDNSTTLTYNNVPRSAKGQAGNQQLQMVRAWLSTLQ